tara:strand:- start:732 stop:1127 length:396 start_codon:yes stop_codon:yes gene_type:complete
MTPTNNPREELESLAKYRQKIIDEIAELRKLKDEAESRIVELVGLKEEGTTTRRSNSFVVKTVGGLNRKIETKDYKILEAQLGENFTDFINVKMDLNLTNFRTADDSVVKILMEHMVMSPKKPYIKIEEIK